jgi:hypothetical protein
VGGIGTTVPAAYKGQAERLGRLGFTYRLETVGIIHSLSFVALVINERFALLSEKIKPEKGGVFTPRFSGSQIFSCSVFGCFEKVSVSSHGFFSIQSCWIAVIRSLIWEEFPQFVPEYRKKFACLTESTCIWFQRHFLCSSKCSVADCWKKGADFGSAPTQITKS